MLEIIFLSFFVGRVGALAKANGRSSGGYQFLTVALWFGFEILGFLLGMLLTGDTESIYLAYIIAIVGAAFGGWLAHHLAGRPAADALRAPIKSTTRAE